MNQTSKFLPATFADTTEMTTASRGVAVLYGRRADGSLIALQVDANGVLASSATFAGTIDVGAVTVTSGNIAVTNTVEPKGSTNSFYQDQGALALTTAFQEVDFLFTSLSISLWNDGTSSDLLTFSFDGTHTHGTLKAGEHIAMDFRAFPKIWLKGSGAINYRLMAY